eukprot:SAG22_NODE_10298_length_542_cov_1.546275_2_plen_69_part_01
MLLLLEKSGLQQRLTVPHCRVYLTATGITDRSVLALCTAVGPALQDLDVSLCPGVTDAALAAVGSLCA